MSLNCKSCGGMRDHYPDFGSRCGSSRSYPSGHDRGGGRTSSSSSSSSRGGLGGTTGGVSSATGLDLLHTSPSISPPKTTVDGIDMSQVGGWHVPSDLEIAKGMNPHFKMLPGDSKACRLAKSRFNQAINDAFNLGSIPGTGGLGMAAEAFRVKKDLERATKETQKQCIQKIQATKTWELGTTVLISPVDFHKYM